MRQAVSLRRDAAGLRGLGTIATMSPTMWGLLGVVVGAGAMYAWSLR